jgi:hypothetical protein
MWNIANTPTDCNSAFYFLLRKMSFTWSLYCPAPSLHFDHFAVLALKKWGLRGKFISKVFFLWLVDSSSKKLCGGGWSSWGLFDVYVCLVYLPASLFCGFPIRHSMGALWLPRQCRNLSDLSKVMTCCKFQRNSKSSYFQQLLFQKLKF